MLGSQSRALQAQGQAKMAKMTQKEAYFWSSSQKTSNPKGKTFYSMSTRRFAEAVKGLNSSPALAAGNLWPKRARQFVGTRGR